MRMPNICRPMCLLIFLAQYPLATAPQVDKLKSVLSDFNSFDSQRREYAYYSIQNDQEALRRPDVQKALIDLLDRENKDQKAPSGEGYIEYLLDLGETINAFADWRDPSQVCILAASPAYSGSAGHFTELAIELATKAGKLAFPCLFRMAYGSPGERDNAITMLLKVSAITADLSSSERQQILKAVMDGLRDPEPGVRLATVMASETLGTPELIPVLQGIAQSDPYSDPEGAKRFRIREAAAKAIQSIQERAKAK